jgi:hypothetical protein
MEFDKQQERLKQNGATTRPAPPGLLTKIAAAVIGAALLVVGFAVSLVMLAVVLGAVIVIGGFLWWKTRDLRKQLREQAMRAQQMHEQQVRERAGQRMDIGDVIVPRRDSTEISAAPMSCLVLNRKSTLFPAPEPQSLRTRRERQGLTIGTVSS